MQDIKSVLSELNVVPEYSGGEISEEWVESKITLLWDYYQQVSRHRYSDITEYVMEQFKNIDDYEKIQGLSDNIKSIIGYLETLIERNCQNNNAYGCAEYDAELQCKGPKEIQEHGRNCSEYTWLYRKLVKLEDHILLEQIRLMESRLEQKVHKKEVDSLESSIEKMKSAQAKLDDKGKTLQGEIRNIYLSVVSVLGIFAAIIIGVFGGLNILDSISTGFLEGDATAYKTLFVTALTVLFVGGIIFLLLALITKMHLDKEISKEAKVIIGIIAITCIVAIIVSICNMEQDKNTKEKITNKSAVKISILTSCL